LFTFLPAEDTAAGLIPDFADISNIAAKSRILEIIFKLKI
jgi:hypothetical protein